LRSGDEENEKESKRNDQEIERKRKREAKIE
jgi:hypothetical protein